MIRVINYKDIDPAQILERKENVFNVADAVSEIIANVFAVFVFRKGSSFGENRFFVGKLGEIGLLAEVQNTRSRTQKNQRE